MKANKALIKMFKEMEFDDYVVEQLLSNKDKVYVTLKRMCKPPHSKGKRSHYDTKTKYGLLYTTFNGIKKSCNLPNYNVRQIFVDMFINDKRFKELFKEWKKGGFPREWKPSFHIIDKDLGNPITKDNIKLDLYENTIKMAHANRGTAVTYLRDGFRVTKIYDSIREAARELEISESTVRGQLGRNEGAFSNFRVTTDKHRRILDGNE